ncbi:hypothetical protein Hmuk_0806 [Halomicrobium mukohataei DSM 12286]|uniref:Uncharacterized protein n=2 Tax=Halomicrobium mukohataei TaxID=57705 RepID=C7P029_HALMD|nr:hypothetical protein Hmuk_0806 [Halomicrobium mukohataei DSM 12286]
MIVPVAENWEAVGAVTHTAGCHCLKILATTGSQYSVQTDSRQCHDGLR